MSRSGGSSTIGPGAATAAGATLGGGGGSAVGGAAGAGPGVAVAAAPGGTGSCARAVDDARKAASARPSAPATLPELILKCILNFIAMKYQTAEARVNRVISGAFAARRLPPPNRAAARKKLAAPQRTLDHRWTVPNPEAKAKKNLLWTSTTYFGEGLPWSFLHQMALEFLTQIGASNTAVGMTSAFHFATMLKFLWSPIVDLFGRLRTWVWVMQIVLGVGMLGVASLSTHGNSAPLWIGLSAL